jgi:uncharacterized protein YgiM (DUF1202 family)
MPDDRKWAVSMHATILHSSPSRHSTVICPVPGGIKLLVPEDYGEGWTKVKYKRTKKGDTRILVGYIRNDNLMKV